MEKERLSKRLWEQGFVLVEDGCLIPNKDGEPCAEPIGVWVDAEGDPVLDTVGDPRPVVFCAKHFGWPAEYEARQLGIVDNWQGHKVAVVLDGPPSPDEINPIPNPF